MSEAALPGREQFQAKVKPYFSAQEFNLLMLAYVLAKYGHRGQMRDEGIRYFEHPKGVALIVIDELGILDFWEIIATALMHDLDEDSWILTEWAIEHIFGTLVARWVKFLTKEEGVDYEQRLMTADWQVLVVKLADRLHNLRTLGFCNADKQARKIEETQRVYLPLADKLIDIIPQKYLHAASYLRESIERICNQRTGAV